MTLRLIALSGLKILAVLLAVLTGVQPAGAADSPVPGMSREEALRAGERMYRDGILPSGEPLQSVVQGDIIVHGKMFSCQSCHLRSGLGTIEGTLPTPPTTGPELYQPAPPGLKLIAPTRERLPDLLRAKDRRPEYTDETLATALWTGVDPSGKAFNPAMPRYFFSEQEMTIMVYYLKNLSAEQSPGVTATELRFATIIAGGVEDKERRSVVEVLQAYVTDWNGETRNQTGRARSGPFYREEGNRAYRKMKLSVWELSGDPATWRQQLEARYREEPVFAVLGGTTAGPWEPIHRFCEDLGLPCLFPATGRPVISGSDWYTLYFSKGPYQEGEAVGRYLRKAEVLGDLRTVVEVYRRSGSGSFAAEGFRSSWKPPKGAELEEIVLEPEEDATARLRERLIAHEGRAAVVWWLEDEIPKSLDELAGLAPRPRMLVMSGSMLGDALASIAEPLREWVYVSYPFRLPSEEKHFQRIVGFWLKTRHIPVLDMRTQADMYFLSKLLTEVVMRIRGDYYRDYLLDAVDMLNDQTYTTATFPRLSFGQGQRYASKGCYIVRLGPGSSPELLPVAGWTIH